MKKKLPAILLAGIMGMTAFASLTACGGGSDVQINWDVDLTKPIDLKGLYPNTGIANFGHDDTAEIIERKTGYKMDYHETAASNEDNEVQNVLTSKENYNILKLTEAQYHPYLEKEYFLDLTELLEKTESGRRLYQLIDLMPNGWDAVKYTNKDGHTGIYGIPDFGFSCAEDTALIWNKEHLKAIGSVDKDGNVVYPSTLGELTDAFDKLQEKYGKDNKNYHAFGLPGSNSVRINTIMSAFDMPLEFYIDGDGNVQQYIFSENTEKYTEYMFGLKQRKVLSDSWQNSSAGDVCSKFSSGLSSCVYLPYWWVTPLVDSIVKKGELAAQAGVKNEYQTVHDEVVLWQTRVRGDGTSGSANQEVAKIQGGDDGVSYYTVIPWYMAEDAVYVIDYLGKKLEYFADFYAGEEGTHWNKVDAPEGAPEYDPADPFCMLPYEDYVKKIIYMRPYSYKLKKTDESGVEKEETMSGGGFWIQLTDRYIEQIADNSQYCNGTNCVAAHSLFHLRETGFDAWRVTVPMDETVITNPMTMAPPFKHWAQISILSRTVAVRGLASAIDSEDAKAAIDITRENMKTTSVRVGSDKYFYWSNDIVTEMTTWYKAVKAK